MTLSPYVEEIVKSVSTFSSWTGYFWNWCAADFIVITVIHMPSKYRDCVRKILIIFLPCRKFRYGEKKNIEIKEMEAGFEICPICNNT